MKLTNLAEATEALKKYMPAAQNWDFALEHMKELMADLGNPQDKLRVIHVAGTSGKTSTCYYLADMLKQAGKTVGLTVSPHVDTVNERTQLNGQPLPEADFCQLLGEFLELPAIKKAQPTYFGVLIAFAYWVFAKQGVDYAVVEVGLGGRLDATNVITRADKVCVITDIGLDHTDFLGDNVVSIAGEKAGIIQPGNQVFMARQDAAVVEVIKARANNQKGQLAVVDQTAAPAELPPFQQRNWNLAKTVVQFVAQRDGFGFSDQQAQASAAVRIPGRMERIKLGAKTLITDGAHNGQKIAALCQAIKQLYPGQKIAVMVSLAQGKDVSLDESMQALSSVASQLIITGFQVEQDVPKRAIDSATLEAAARKAGLTSLQVVDDPKTAFAKLLQCPEPLLLVTGSFYLLNHIRPLIKELT